MVQKRTIKGVAFLVQDVKAFARQDGLIGVLDELRSHEVFMAAVIVAPNQRIDELLQENGLDRYIPCARVVVTGKIDHMSVSQAAKNIGIGTEQMLVFAGDAEGIRAAHEVSSWCIVAPFKPETAAAAIELQPLCLFTDWRQPGIIQMLSGLLGLVDKPRSAPRRRAQWTGHE